VSWTPSAITGHPFANGRGAVRYLLTVAGRRAGAERSRRAHRTLSSNDVSTRDSELPLGRTVELTRGRKRAGSRTAPAAAGGCLLPGWPETAPACRGAGRWEAVSWTSCRPAGRTRLVREMDREVPCLQRRGRRSRVRYRLVSGGLKTGGTRWSGQAGKVGSVHVAMYPQRPAVRGGASS